MKSHIHHNIFVWLLNQQSPQHATSKYSINTRLMVSILTALSPANKISHTKHHIFSWSIKLLINQKFITLRHEQSTHRVAPTSTRAPRSALVYCTLAFNKHQFSTLMMCRHPTNDHFENILANWCIICETLWLRSYHYHHLTRLINHRR